MPWSFFCYPKTHSRILNSPDTAVIQILKNINCALPKTPFSIFLWQSTRRSLLINRASLINCALLFNCVLLVDNSHRSRRYRWPLGFNIANRAWASNATCCWPRNKSPCRLSCRVIKWQSLSPKHPSTGIRPSNWRLQCHRAKTIVYKKNAPGWFSSKTPNQQNWNNSAIAHWNPANPTKSVEFRLLIQSWVMISTASCHDWPSSTRPRWL